MGDAGTGRLIEDLPEVARTRFSRRFKPHASVSATLAISMLAIAIAVAIRVTFATELNHRGTFIFFVPAVVLAGGLSGIRAGAVTVLAGAGAGIWCDSLAGPVGRGSLIAATAFIIIGTAISIGGEWLQRARIDAERALAMLAEREAHLRSILDTVPDAMVVIDEGGTITDYSSAAERMFGWTAQEAIGRNVGLLMPEPDRHKHDGYLARYYRTGERHVIGVGRQSIGERKGGSAFPVEITVGEMATDGKRSFTAFLHDVTKRQRSEAKLRELQNELVHVSRLTALGEMASSLAHEINQPLSAITNYLRGSQILLARDDVPHARVSDAVERAANEALRAGDIIRRLRDFVARGETERSVQFLTEMVEEAGALALVGARELDIAVSYRFEDGVDRVLADRVQILQVVVNLVRNAIDAMTEAQSPERKLTIAVEAVDIAYARVTVTDTGPGVAPEVADLLFKPFITTKRTGLGVGLSISRTIVEAHGGRIWAAPAAGGGAEFGFTLQRVPDPGHHHAAR